MFHFFIANIYVYKLLIRLFWQYLLLSFIFPYFIQHQGKFPVCENPLAIKSVIWLSWQQMILLDHEICSIIPATFRHCFFTPVSIPGDILISVWTYRFVCAGQRILFEWLQLWTLKQEGITYEWCRRSSWLCSIQERKVSGAMSISIFFYKTFYSIWF